MLKVFLLPTLKKRLLLGQLIRGSGLFLRHKLKTMPAPVDLVYSTSLNPSDPEKCGCLIVGKLDHLKRLNFSQLSSKLSPNVNEEVFNKGIQCLSPSPTDSVHLWMKNVSIASLPLKVSRHNAPMLPHSLPPLVKSNLPGLVQEYVVLVCERSSAFALGCAVAKAFPLYTRKKGSIKARRTVTVEFVFVGEDVTPLTQDEADCVCYAAESVRLAAKIVDMPCSEMHTDGFLEEIKRVGEELGIEPMIIRGDELDKRGFGGIYGVGKAAIHPPALAVLSHTPEGATQNIAWVGKGIVYDTGGLSIKDKTHMPGMKRDCGGAAGVLGAFRAAVKSGFKENLHCVLCLAENAVGPLATRPDDIHKFYSGLTVEVNNTDAEGRLVLGDGVAYASKDLKANIIVDMATLTGAQGISTGKSHAAIITNNEDWETYCVQAGRASGDLTHPLPFCPEMHFSEFNSSVADMKNSVKDRGNAQSSCAGLFIFAHLGFDFPGVWLHIDMAYPVHVGERATGYGVALLMTLFGQYSKNSILESIAPKI